MKKIIIGLSIIIIACLIAVALLLPPPADTALKDAFIKLRNGNYNSEYQTKTLSNGDYFAFIVEHSCCSGNGYFDAVAIRTSQGIEYSSKNNYCGYEGFWGEVAGRVNTLEELDHLLLESGFTKLNAEQSP